MHEDNINSYSGITLSSKCWGTAGETEACGDVTRKETFDDASKCSA